MNTSDFYSRCFKSSVKMFSQVICYCMCKQTKYKDPSIRPTDLNGIKN